DQRVRPPAGSRRKQYVRPDLRSECSDRPCRHLVWPWNNPSARRLVCRCDRRGLPRRLSSPPLPHGVSPRPPTRPPCCQQSVDHPQLERAWVEAFFCRTFYARAVEFMEKIETRANALPLRNFAIPQVEITPRQEFGSRGSIRRCLPLYFIALKQLRPE